MTWKLTLTDEEVAVLKALDGKPLGKQPNSGIEVRLLKLELAGQNEAGGLYRTAYGDLRLHIAR
jgi:hypothetical protein